MRVLGLISGTSVDAIDVAVCEFMDDPPAGSSLRLIGHREVAWNPELRARILGVYPPATTTVGEICALDQAVGQAFGAAAASVIDEFGPVDLVASHGQTVFHWVENGVALGTLQLGEAARIQQATGVPVLSNLRAADIAAGGQGAPLAPVLDVLLFADRRTAVVNLGGIANITIVDTADDGYPVALAGGDTGTANCLLDAVMLDETGESYDADGALASTGTLDEVLLVQLRAHPWLALPMPKSTGREVFSLAWLRDQVALHTAATGRLLALPDLLATLAHFTASTLLDQIRPFGVERVVVSGGGQHHGLVMALLRAEHREVLTTDELGLPGYAKEAVLMALVGWLSATGRAGVALNVDGRPLTGASEAKVLGQLSQSDPTVAAPTSLRLLGTE